MARIAGVDIPKQKRGVISLTYIYGVGKSRAKDILETAGVSEDKKVSDWNDDEIGKIRDAVSAFTIGEINRPILAVLAERNFFRHPVDLLLLFPELISPWITERLISVARCK